MKKPCEQKLYSQKGPIYIILAQPTEHGKERYENPETGQLPSKIHFGFRYWKLAQQITFSNARYLSQEKRTELNSIHLGVAQTPQRSVGAAALHGPTGNNTYTEPLSPYMCMVLHCAVQIHQHQDTMKKPMVTKIMLDHTWRIWLQNIWGLSMTSLYIRASFSSYFQIINKSTTTIYWQF